MIANPIIVETTDIKKEIHEYAMQNKLGLSHVDFKLLDIKTKITYSKSEETEEYSLPFPNSIFNTATFIDESVYIEQYYEIEIFEGESKSLFKYTIVSTKSKCNIYLIIPKNQIIKYTDDISTALITDIKKKLAKLGILVDLFESSISKNLYPLLSKLKVNTALQVDEDIKILILKSIEPVLPINGHLERLYTNRIITDMDRGFVIDVSENELLMIYKKPVKGINGRDCYGDIIHVSEPNNGNACNKKMGKGIRFDEDEDEIRVFSTTNGYFNDAFDEISIENELEIDSISFRNTGAIDTNIDNNITINVNQPNFINDAINSTNVDSKTINITGNVGHNAYIVSETINISGQVHASSEIKATNININRLKGVANGEEITIDILEQGRVKGKNISISVANGGLIIGENVFLDEVNGNTVIFASKKIEINRINGEDNLFYIDPYATKNAYEISEKLNKKAALEAEIKKLLLQKADYTRQMRSQAGPIKEIRKKMEYLKTKNIDLPMPMKLLYTKYKELAVCVKNIQHHEFMNMEEIKEIDLYLDIIGGTVEDGVMITHNRWSEHNKVIFKLPAGVEMEYKPKKGEKLDSIRVKNEENKYVFVIEKELKNG